jgi:hypothetical protein
MVAIVSVETVLLVLLLVLVAGLLRSNAEILRRLGPPGEPGPGPIAPPGRPAAHPRRCGAGAGGSHPGGGRGQPRLQRRRRAHAAGLPDQRLWHLRRLLGNARRA